MHQLRCLKYCRTGLTYFKIDFENDFQILPHRLKTDMPLAQPQQMYLNQLKISKQKWTHILQDLRNYIPTDTHAFNDNLPGHAESAKDCKSL